MHFCPGSDVDLDQAGNETLRTKQPFAYPGHTTQNMLFASNKSTAPKPDMQIKTVRKPGEPGTQKLVAKYGERLVSVRYRYDPQAGKRYKTVELIIAEEDWQPAEATPIEAPPKPERPTTPLVPVRIHYTEKDLQRQIKAIGGTWDAKRKHWYAPEAYVKRIGLTKRIVR